MIDGLRFVIYDKLSQFRRQISGVEADADIVPNGISTASFTIDEDHIAAPDIVADGARCGVWFRGKERFRGRISATPGEGPTGSLTAFVECDMRKFWDWYGWQVPTAGIAGQSAAAYRVYTGRSEEIFKAALSENVTRLGVPWTIAADHGFGLTTKAEFRMHPLADKLIPVLDADDLIVTLSYPGGMAVHVDVREANTVNGTLTLKSGVPDAYEFTRTAPTATRVIVGGRGQGIEREFIQAIDTARESAWGDIIETFVDARNTEEGADLTIDANEALADGAPRTGFSTDLVETSRFMYGKTYEVGDLVHVKVGAVDSIEQITSVSISETSTNGVIVTPHIGTADVSSDTDVELAQSVAALARGFRDSGRG